MTVLAVHSHEKVWKGLMFPSSHSILEFFPSDSKKRALCRLYACIWVFCENVPNWAIIHFRGRGWADLFPLPVSSLFDMIFSWFCLHRFFPFLVYADSFLCILFDHGCGNSSWSYYQVYLPPQPMFCECIWMPLAVFCIVVPLFMFYIFQSCLVAAGWVFCGS